MTGHYIFCPVVSSLFFFFSFFLAYSQPSQIGCLSYFHTWCGLSANLECRSEMCCMRLAEKYRTQKNRHLRTIAQLCRAVSSKLRHVSTIGKKLLNINISSTCLHNMANFGTLTAEIGSGVWGTPANFNGFRVLPSLLQLRRSPEANQTLRNWQNSLRWKEPPKMCSVYSVPAQETAKSCANSLYVRVLRSPILVALTHHTALE